MHYSNFDLWIEEETERGFPLHASAERMGEVQRDWMELDPEDLRDLVECLEERRTDRQLLVELGEKLYSALFRSADREIEALFQRHLGETRGDPDLGVRLRLRLGSPALAALPWELLRAPDQDHFLGASIETALVRYLEVPQPVRDLSASPPINMLVVVPEAKGLNTEEERQNLQNALEPLEGMINPTWIDGGATRAAIGEALIEQEFGLLHFIGHGDFDGERAVLYLDDGRGGVDAVDESEVAGLLLNHTSMKLVVLNSCRGATVSSSRPMVGMAPGIVRESVPAVVAMQYGIYDDVAVEFSRVFYTALLKSPHRGRVDVAVCQARNQLAVEFPGERAVAAPVLFLRSPEGVLFELEQPGGLARSLLSTQQAHTARAVKITREHNLDSLQVPPGEETEEQQKQLEEEHEELDRLRKQIRLRRFGLLTAAGAALLCALVAWVALLDILTLETRAELFTLALADRFVSKQPRADLATIAIQPQRHEESFGLAWRPRLAVLLEELTRAEARVVGFDVAFPRPSDDPQADRALREAFRNAAGSGTTVIVAASHADPQGNPELAEPFRDVVGGWGFTQLGRRLGVGMTAHLAATENDVRDEIWQRSRPYSTPRASFALRCAMAHGGADPSAPVEIDPWEPRIRFPTGHDESASIGCLEQRVVGHADRDSLIPAGSLRAGMALDLTSAEAGNRYAYSDIMTRGALQDPERFKDKTVIVGVETEPDRHPVFGLLGRRRRWGVDIQADTVRALLNAIEGRQPLVRRPSFGWLVLFLLAAGAAGAAARFSVVTRRPHGPKYLLLGATIGWVVLSIILYRELRLLLNIIHGPLVLLVTYWFLGVIKRRWI